MLNKCFKGLAVYYTDSDGNEIESFTLSEHEKLKKHDVISIITFNGTKLNVEAASLRRMPQRAADKQRYQIIFGRLLSAPQRAIKRNYTHGKLKISTPNKENLAKLSNAKSIGFDIETYADLRIDGGSGLIPHKGCIRLLQAYLPTESECIVWDLGNYVNPSDPALYLGLEVLLERLQSKDCKIYIHNADFESRWMLEKYNTPIVNVVDSMLLSQIYYAGLDKAMRHAGIDKPHSLGALTSRLFPGYKVDKELQVYDYFLAIDQSHLNYGSTDAKLTWGCGVVLEQMCDDVGLGNVVEAEMSAIPAFSSMNHYGLPVCLKKVDKLIADYSKACDDLELEFLKYFPGVNYKSPLQVKKALVAAYGDGLTETSYEKLWEFIIQADDGVNTEPIKTLTILRKAKKNLEYLISYKEKAIERNGRTVVLPNYRQMAPRGTGRSASSKPNCQNIPNLDGKLKAVGYLESLRSCFRVDGDYTLIVVDVAASHAVLAESLSGDAVMNSATKNNIKIHYLTLQGILDYMGIHLTVDEIKKAHKDDKHEHHELVSKFYSLSKTAFYSQLNLASPKTLQTTNLKRGDILLSYEDAKTQVQATRFKYKGLMDFIFGVILSAKLNITRLENVPVYNTEGQLIQLKSKRGNGYFVPITAVDGRRLFVECLRKGDDVDKDNVDTKYSPSMTDAISFQWLAPEATMMKRALARIWWYIKENQLDARLFEMTHDEIGLMCHKDIAVELGTVVHEIIKNEVKYFAPNYEPSDFSNKSIGMSWVDIH